MNPDSPLVEAIIRFAVAWRTRTLEPLPSITVSKSAGLSLGILPGEALQLATPGGSLEVRAAAA